MGPTVLVYSSHNRCNYIHNDWIVQRALRGNRRILFLPLSMATDDGDSDRHQRYNWDNFSWFFDFYRGHGLDAFPFFWRADLRKEDVELLWHALASAEVVILGGGNPKLGMRRYRELGERFAGDPDRFRRALEERKHRGQLTVGYSAGVDQLCELMSSVSGYGAVTPGFGLARKIVATSHFAHGQEPWLEELARSFGRCLVFGLPNDSGLAVSEGQTSTGRYWQLVHMITDCSWALPADAGHVKTRQGMLIQHCYPDGRHWAFNGGDTLLRLRADGYDEAFILTPGAPIRDYWTQEWAPFASVDEILAAR
jgi:hypothetical protein